MSTTLIHTLISNGERANLECKRAQRNIPNSIWETYSAFANTFGGVILLGVKESETKNFIPVDLPDPQALIDEFWYNINNPYVVSVNILKKEDVYIQTVHGKHIVVINVPMAHPLDRPVFIEHNPLKSYRRDGEGDVLFSKTAIFGMIRDAMNLSEDCCE